MFFVLDYKQIWLLSDSDQHHSVYCVIWQLCYLFSDLKLREFSNLVFGVSSPSIMLSTSSLYTSFLNGRTTNFVPYINMAAHLPSGSTRTVGKAHAEEKSYKFRKKHFIYMYTMVINKMYIFFLTDDDKVSKRMTCFYFLRTISFFSL